jgi:hypothetical protein
MSGNILSPEERQQLTLIPLEISEADLVRFFTLHPDDLDWIDFRTKASHQLDQAAHLCLLRWLGWSPVRVDRLPAKVLAALCQQLDLVAPSGELDPLPDRTSRQHAQRAREHLGWRAYTAEMEPSLKAWLKSLAAEHDHGAPLLAALLRHLYQEKIVRPGLTHLERLVATVRDLVKVEVA